MEKKWNLEPNSILRQNATEWHGQWLVLRCSNRNTIPLVLALREIGAEAWTPLWLRHRRFPRSHQRREVLMPCLPSFVFLAERDGKKAVEAGNSVPGFSIMLSYGSLVIIEDRDLEPLRRTVERLPRSRNPIAWPATGERRRIISGAFQGMNVTVEGRSNRHCLVTIDRSDRGLVKVPPFLLAQIEA